jgi:hypothetical protein
MIEEINTFKRQFFYHFCFIPFSSRYKMEDLSPIILMSEFFHSQWGKFWLTAFLTSSLLVIILVFQSCHNKLLGIRVIYQKNLLYHKYKSWKPQIKVSDRLVCFGCGVWRICSKSLPLAYQYYLPYVSVFVFKFPLFIRPQVILESESPYSNMTSS